jgi:hypothetical protein
MIHLSDQPGSGSSWSILDTRGRLIVPSVTQRMPLPANGKARSIRYDRGSNQQHAPEP